MLITHSKICTTQGSVHTGSYKSKSTQENYIQHIQGLRPHDKIKTNKRKPTKKQEAPPTKKRKLQESQSTPKTKTKASKEKKTAVPAKRVQQFNYRSNIGTVIKLLKGVKFTKAQQTEL